MNGEIPGMLYYSKPCDRASIDQLRRLRGKRGQYSFQAIRGIEPSVRDHGACVAARLDCEKLIPTLTARQRQVIVLRYWDRMNQPEIAKEMGICGVTVAVLFHQAFQKLRRLTGCVK